MTTRSFARLGISVLMLAAFAGGCSKNETPLSTADTSIGGTNSLDQIDLNQAYGGLAYTDEAPAFDDSQLQSETATMEQNLMTEDDEDSVLERDPALRDSPQLKRTVVRILWGKLDGRPVVDASSPAMALDWSGSLSVTGGAIAVKRTILFEPPVDHLLPRVNRQLLQWQSYTGPHFDGLLLCILQRPDDTGAFAGELSFKTGPFSTTISLADLDGLDRSVSVDDQGNSISFEGKTLDNCPSGFMRGYWVRVPGTSGGFFRGHWVDQFGDVNGHLRGRWGVSDVGERVFAGKIIDRAGHIRGLLRGTWEPKDDGTGVFSGHWAAKYGQIEGEFGGEYMTRGDLGLGFFRAMWKAECSGSVVDNPPNDVPNPPPTGRSGN